jgi:hypothetical protein
MPRLLELFSGTQSVSRVARRLGWETVSLDIDPANSPDLCCSVLDFDETAWPRDSFTFVWASPPCESYSSANNRFATDPDHEVAMAAADELIRKTARILQHFSCAWVVENPLGSRLWRREVAQLLGGRAHKVAYCQYGFPYRKLTRLQASWALHLATCPGAGKCAMMRGTAHLEWAQKGGGGAQPRFKQTAELHKIPEPLVEEIFRQLQNAQGSPRGPAGPGEAPG